MWYWYVTRKLQLVGETGCKYQRPVLVHGHEIHIVYDSANIMGYYCVCCVAGEWFVCFVILKVRENFSEVVFILCS